MHDGYVHRHATRPVIATCAKRRSSRTISCARTARRCRRIARVGSTRSGSSSISSPSIPRPTVADDLAATAPRRCVHEPPISRSRLPRPTIPTSSREIYGDAWPEPSAPATGRSSRRPSTSSASTTTRATSFATRPASRRCMPRACARSDNIHTEMDWEVFPAALTRVLLWVKERYGNIPLYVTENGAAFDDPPHATDGMRRRSAPRLVPARASPRRARCDRARRRPPRLLRLVAARQLRVEPSATRSDSASCTSTSTRSSARPSRARASTPR